MNINDIQTFVLYNGMNSVATTSVVPTELTTCTDKCRRHDLYCNPAVLTPGYKSRILINSEQ